MTDIDVTLQRLLALLVNRGASANKRFRILADPYYAFKSCSSTDVSILRVLRISDQNLISEYRGEYIIDVTRVQAGT